LVFVNFLYNESVSKVCCCYSGESRTRSEAQRYPAIFAHFWTPAFAGVTLFDSFEIGSLE